MWTARAISPVPTMPTRSFDDAMPAPAPSGSPQSHQTLSMPAGAPHGKGDRSRDVPATGRGRGVGRARWEASRAGPRPLHGLVADATHGAGDGFQGPIDVRRADAVVGHE